MHEFFKRQKTIRRPTVAQPWFETEYTDYSDFTHFLQFTNDIDNLVRLRQQEQPFLVRGHANAEWTLKPKLVRLLEGVPLEEALQYEFNSVCYFRERAHLFCTALVPQTNDLFEWLALMQHFSAPTRMLDWTSSFTVALYFAVCEEPIDCPGAVWIVQNEPLFAWMRTRYPLSEFFGADKGQKGMAVR